MYPWETSHYVGLLELVQASPWAERVRSSSQCRRVHYRHRHRDLPSRPASPLQPDSDEPVNARRRLARRAGRRRSTGRHPTDRRRCRRSY